MGPPFAALQKQNQPTLSTEQISHTAVLLNLHGPYATLAHRQTVHEQATGSMLIAADFSSMPQLGSGAYGYCATTTTSSPVRPVSENDVACPAETML